VAVCGAFQDVDAARGERSDYLVDLTDPHDDACVRLWENALEVDHSSVDNGEFMWRPSCAAGQTLFVSGAWTSVGAFNFAKHREVPSLDAFCKPGYDSYHPYIDGWHVLPLRYGAMFAARNCLFVVCVEEDSSVTHDQ
jgi:hypothetical protein